MTQAADGVEASIGDVMTTSLLVPFVFTALAALVQAANEQQIPGSHSDYATFAGEKRGRVVDAETKQGVKDATLVATWSFIQYGWNSSTDCRAIRVLHTDAHGALVIPDMSAELKVDPLPFGGILSGERFFMSRLSVFAPGYIRLGDLGEIRAAADWNRTPRFPWPSMEKLIKSSDGDMGDLYVQRSTLSGIESLVYDGALLRSISCRDDAPRSVPGFEALLADIKARHGNLPCDLARPTPLSTELLSTYSYVMRYGDPKRGRDRRSFHPGWVKELMKVAGPEWSWDTASLTAGTLCDAVEAARDDNNED